MEELYTQIDNLLPDGWVHTAVWAVILLVATVVTARVATRVVRHVLRSDENPLPSSSIIVNIVRATIWAVGASIILDTVYNQNSNAIITALGVGGIAVSLGFQDTLSNLIGGLQMAFMGIIKPGDNIQVDSQIGVVQDISWRHTTIRDPLGQTVIIPNSVISKTALVHLLPANRVVVPFAIPRYRDDGTDISTSLDALSDRIIGISCDAAGSVSPVIGEPNIFFSEITELGIKGKVIMQVEDVTLVAKAADAVVRAIAKLLD